MPPPTWGAVRGGAGRSTSGNGEVVRLAAGVGWAPLPGAAGGPDAPVGEPLGPDTGDAAGDADGGGAEGDGETRATGTGVSATMAAPRPAAAPIPMTSPMTTAMKVRIAEEGTARDRAPPASDEKAEPAGSMTARMHPILRWARRRLLPAALTAAGVSLVGAGLLTYGTQPQTAAPSPSPLASSAPSAFPTLIPFPTPEPSSAASASPAAARVATRVVVPALRIDLPVVRPPNDPAHFPYCNVAEYVPTLSQPGLAGTTYLYAHARDGMFLPLLLQSRVDNGSAMLGMLVQVYTSDDRVFLYEIVRVLRHQSELYTRPQEQLALQTSEGPRQGVPGYTGLVMMVVANPISSGPADHAAANPTARPVTCQ